MGVFLNRISRSEVALPAAPAQVLRRPLARALQAQLARALPSHVPGSLRRLVRAPNVIKCGFVEDSLLMAPQPAQIHLLTGVDGLGKATVLRALGEQCMVSNFLVLTLESPNELDEVLARLERETGLDAEEIGSLIRYCLVRRAWERDLSALSVLRSHLSGAMHIASCGPLCAGALKQGLGTSVFRWELQPLEDKEARFESWSAAGASDPEALAHWSMRSPLHQTLAGNPLFIQLAARVGLPERLPRTGLLAADYIDAVTCGIESEFGSPTAPLCVLAKAMMEEGLTFFSPSVILELERRGTLSISPMVEPFGGLEKLLRLLHGTGLLGHIPPDHFEFRHPFFPVVIVARALAREPDKLSTPICLAEHGLEREVALHIPAFAPNGLDALDRMTAQDDHLWLMGLPLLSAKEIRRHAARVLSRLRKTLLAAGTARAAEALTLHEGELVGMMGDSGITGLLTVLVELEIQDPTLLGAILCQLDHPPGGRLEFRPLLTGLLSHLGEPPARPPLYELNGQGGGYVAIADHAVSNAQFGSAFGTVQPPNRYSHGPLQPRTDVNWYGAYAFAHWWGGRLPTRAEYEQIMPRFSAAKLRPDVLNTRDTCKRLVPGGKGTLEVHHRLPNTPDPGNCVHLLGNVREWCLDAPPGRTEFRWTLGGSFNYRPGEAEFEAAHNYFPDVGFRVCWDEPEQATMSGLLVARLPGSAATDPAAATVEATSGSSMPLSNNAHPLRSLAPENSGGGTQPPSRALRLYICYAPKDVRHLKKFRDGLANLERQGAVKSWCELDLEPGQAREIEKLCQLRSAGAIVLLVSPDFMANDQIHAELKLALERNANENVRVVPILVRPTDLAGSGIDALQALPVSGLPVSRWTDSDQAWLAVIEGLRPMIARLP